MSATWNPADPIETWLSIGLANRWIRRAVDPPFTRASFTRCADAADLKARLAHGNWCLGTAFCLDDLCFIEQTSGTGEWLVIKQNVAFESASCAAMIERGTFDEFLARIMVATPEQCASLRVLMLSCAPSLQPRSAGLRLAKKFYGAGLGITVRCPPAHRVIMHRMSDADPNDVLSGHDRTQPAASDYTLTIEEASELFAEAGVPRNPRSIRRFCQNRQLDCISIETPTSNRYLISRSSAEKLIVEKQQAMRFAADHRSADTSGHDRLEPDMTGHDRTRPDIHAAEREAAADDAAAMIKRLEDENLNLRIDNRAKEQVITMLRDERREIQKQFQEVSYRLGSAETRVAQLQAPKSSDHDVRPAQYDQNEMPDIESPSAPPEITPDIFWPNAE